MPKYTCNRCLKEFSQKSHYDKHQNKKKPCQDNKGKIEEIVENIIINKKLISNNTENIITHIIDNTIKSNMNESKNIKFTREYLNKEKVCLVNGDCLDVMLNIENESIDLILCDLPYGVTKNKWDVIIPFDKLWEQYNRIIKGNGAIVLFGSQPFTTMLISSNMKNFSYQNSWNKINEKIIQTINEN